jgi:hypothetical protein
LRFLTMLGPASNMKRSRSVRAYVVELVIAVTLPLLAFGSFLLVRSALNEQQLIAATAGERAQGTAADLDRELRNLQHLVSVLATSRYLVAGDVPGSHVHAAQLLRDQNLGLVVTDQSGQPVLNTCAANGGTAPVRKPLGDVTYGVDDGRARISDLMTEPISDEPPLLTIDLPVWRDDNSAYMLSLCALPRILQILRQQHLPDGWTAVVFDRQQRAIASIIESAAGSFSAAGGDRAVVPTADRNWIADFWGNSGPAQWASSSVDSAGWTVAISVPNDVFFGPVRRSLIVLLLAGGGTVVLVLVFAFNIGRRIAGPIAELSGMAMAPRNAGQLRSDALASTRPIWSLALCARRAKI